MRTISRFAVVPLLVATCLPATPPFRVSGTTAVAVAGPGAVVLRHGDQPYDAYGAREASVFTDPAQPARLFMHYDACGPTGWLAALATSDDGGLTWVKRGLRLHLGTSWAQFTRSASSPWVRRGPDGRWHMWYLGTRWASPAPDNIPEVPYYTQHATAPGPYGPWSQWPTAMLGPKPGTWMSASASPGSMFVAYDRTWMVFSGSGPGGRSIGLAQAPGLDGPWTPRALPLLPTSENVENATLFWDPYTRLWWMFVNHVGSTLGTDGRVYTDAVWGYHSTDPLRWSAATRTVFVTGASSGWTRVVGMPSVARQGSRLAIFYDGKRDGTTDHMGRDIAVSYAPLPLPLPG